MKKRRFVVTTQRPGAADSRERRAFPFPADDRAAARRRAEAWARGEEGQGRVVVSFEAQTLR